MIKANTISKILFIFIFIQFSSNVFANCVSLNNGVSINQGLSDNNNSEYLIRLNSNTLTNKDLNFIRINTGSNECLGKTLILEINDDIIFNITGNKVNQYIGGIDEIRFNNGSFTFDVNNNDNLGITTIDINVNYLNIIGANNNYIFFWEEYASRELGGNNGLKLKLKNIIINENSDFNILIEQSSFPYTGYNGGSLDNNVDGTPAILDVNSITNYGGVYIKIFGGKGGIDLFGNGGTHNSPNGGNGGNGGLSRININYFINKSTGNSKIIQRSGQGGVGATGAGENYVNCIGPSNGGNGGNGGAVDFNILNIYNEGDLSIDLVSEFGGNGGNVGLGASWGGCQGHDSNVDGGTGGSGGNIKFNISYLKNNGEINFNSNSGRGGNGGNTGNTAGNSGNYHAYGLKGKGGDGGNIFDLNIFKILNFGDFNFYSKSGEIGVSGSGTGTGRNFISKAGDVGSINIDYLNNTSPDFEIKTELNESDIENLSSVNCGCFDDCGSATDPTIGDINIKYLASGSFLPKKLEIIKHVPVNETNINIEGCHVNSLGNSEISYIADNLILRLANLATIQNDFDNNSYHIGDILVEERICPVCDGLELDNMTLRTDTIYTIYTDVAANGNIVDLNIYYVNPDGNLFKPPGHPANQDYVVYSLIPGETINPAGSSRFSSNGITEYKISKDKLYYNPEAIELNDLSPGIHGYGRDDVRLFCQGQRYLLRFRFESDPAIKEIYFTPIFDID